MLGLVASVFVSMVGASRHADWAGACATTVAASMAGAALLYAEDAYLLALLAMPDDYTDEDVAGILESMDERAERR